jgi:putative alpha-1,2-mannosidase
MVLLMMMLMLDLPLVVKTTKAESTMINTMPTATRPTAVIFFEPLAFVSVRGRPLAVR